MRPTEILDGPELVGLLQHVPDIVWRYRLVAEPGFEYVSPSAFALTGCTPEEVAEALLGFLAGDAA